MPSRRRVPRLMNASGPAPFVKWAGGKGQLLAQLRPYFPQHYLRYIEPFVGGGAVFFHLQPESALLADLNPELVNLYRVVRDMPEKLMVQLDRMGQRTDHEAYYYELREKQPVDLPPARQDQDGIPLADEDRLWIAARTIYLNKTGFNGLFRVNSRGRFNVPWGRRTRLPQLYHPASLLSAAQLLHATDIHLADFAAILDQAQPGDFVYLDPPYHPLSATASFTNYTRLDFPPAEQERLAACLWAMDRRGVRFLLNNSDTPYTRHLYAGFHVSIARARRTINRDAAKRGPVNELIVYNYTPSG
jgi:DNA adenine methylase